MRNNKKKIRFSAGSQQSSQQNLSAGNRFKGQLDRFKMAYGIPLGYRSDKILADILGLTRGAIADWKNKKEIPAKWIVTIRRDKGIREGWIENGEDPMLQEHPSIRQAKGRYQVFTEIPSGEELLPDSFLLIDYVKAPLGAGDKFPIPNASRYELLAFRNDWIAEVASSPENLILLPVRGPSMEKTIFDGDLVMVDIGRKEIIRDLIYAVRIEKTLTIKRLQTLPDGRIRLISDNKDFPPEDFSPEEIDVAGRVIWLAREFVKNTL